MDEMSALRRILENQVVILGELEREAGHWANTDTEKRFQNAICETKDLLKGQRNV